MWQNFESAKLIYPDESEKIVRLLGEDDDLIAIVGAEAHDYYKYKDHDYDYDYKHKHKKHDYYKGDLLAVADAKIL